MPMTLADAGATVTTGRCRGEGIFAHDRGRHVQKLCKSYAKERRGNECFKCRDRSRDLSP